MSTHFWCTTTVELESLNEVRDRALAALAKINPLFAAKLRKLDWSALAQETLSKAMETTSGWTWTPKPTKASLPNFKGTGTLLGTLRSGQLYLVAAFDKKGSILFHHGRYDSAYVSENPREWEKLRKLQKEVLRRYREESAKLMATFLGRTLKTEKLPDGRTKITVDLKGQS